MLGTVVDTALGLVFCYFLLSLIASAVQEILASVFAWRGTYLSRGIDVILDNRPDAAFAWDGVGEFLHAHFTPAAPATTAEKLARNPDAAGAVGATPKQMVALRKVASVQRHPFLRGAPSRLPAYVSAQQFALALLEALGDGSQAPLFTQVQKTIDALPDGDLKRTLTMFLKDAGGDLDKFRAHIEAWFDSAMDRLSGVYARLSRYVTLILGLVLAVTLNVDTLRLTRTLWLNDDMRAAIVANATTAAPPPSGTPAEATIQQAWTTLESQNLPLGWSSGTTPFQGHGWIVTLGGWLLTALAISLGAPFWFSLLQQIGNLRGDGPRPKRSTATSP